MFDAAVPTESERVEAWRLHELLEGGYPVAIAEKLAVAGDVDLHRAIELLDHGCAPSVAAEILL